MAARQAESAWIIGPHQFRMGEISWRAAIRSRDFHACIPSGIRPVFHAAVMQLQCINNAVAVQDAKPGR
jgi:hypothetical protein